MSSVANPTATSRNWATFYPVSLAKQWAYRKLDYLRPIFFWEVLAMWFGKFLVGNTVSNPVCMAYRSTGAERMG